MRFTIAAPAADGEVQGWVCPDDYRERPRVRVVLDGRHETMLDCTVEYPLLREWNWHETGVCGFALNEATLPGSLEAQRLEVFDPGTNVLLYRRIAGAAPLARKLLLVNTGGEAERALQNALFDRFQTSYFSIEDMSEETLASLMAYAKSVPSMALAGHVLVPRYEDACAHSAIEVAILIRDPWETLAARIDRLRRDASVLDADAQAWRVAHRREAIAFARAFDPRDRRAARRLLRDLPEAAYRHLADPLTRQLGTKQAGGTVGADHTAVAVEVLSRIDVVGHAAYQEAFLATLFDRLETAMPEIEATRPPPEVLAAAQALREDGEAAFLIANDLRLSEAVSDIIGKQWAA